jgi:hypothetical protein
LNIKIIIMDFVCVNARFKFWDGKLTYTVEYAYGINSWFVFEGQKESDCMFSKKINPAKSKSPNRSEAEDILIEYLDSL